jgi:hypothetical protein
MTELKVKPETTHDFRFFVQDHAKVQNTINEVVGTKEACNFCQGAPIVIVYRGWNDKIVTACKEHEEIVLEMIERDK